MDDGNTAQGSVDASATDQRRPWYRKKRFIIPLALVGLLIIGPCLRSEPGGDPRTATGTSEEGAKPEAEVTGELEITGTGLSTAKRSYDDNFYVSAAAAIRNASSGMARGIVVNLNLKDASGQIVKSAVTSLSYIAAGEEAYATTDIFLDEGQPLPVSVEAQARARAFDREPAPVFTFSATRYVSDDSSGKILGTITNPMERDATEVHVTCATYDGVRVTGGGYTFVDLVPAGGTTGFEASNGVIYRMKVSEVRCSGALSSLSE